jgi:hypothetical protein
MGYPAKATSDVSTRPPIIVNCCDNDIELLGDPAVPPSEPDVDALLTMLAGIARRAASIQSAPTEKAA